MSFKSKYIGSFGRFVILALSFLCTKLVFAQAQNLSPIEHERLVLLPPAGWVPHERIEKKQNALVRAYKKNLDGPGYQNGIEGVAEYTFFKVIHPTNIDAGAYITEQLKERCSTLTTDKLYKHLGQEVQVYQIDSCTNDSKVSQFSSISRLLEGEDNVFAFQVLINSALTDKSLILKSWEEAFFSLDGAEICKVAAGVDLKYACAGEEKKAGLFLEQHNSLKRNAVLSYLQLGFEHSEINKIDNRVNTDFIRSGLGWRDNEPCPVKPLRVKAEESNLIICLPLELKESVAVEFKAKKGLQLVRKLMFTDEIEGHLYKLSSNYASSLENAQGKVEAEELLNCAHKKLSNTYMQREFFPYRLSLFKCNSPDEVPR